MANSVTVTVQLDGASGTSRNFEIGDSPAAPPPPDMSGDSADDAGSVEM